MGPRSKRPRREEVSGGGASRATQKEQGNAACCKASWMEKSHDRDGDKALLSYNFAKGPELENPLDPSSRGTGNTRYVLDEIYETPAGIEDHWGQAQDSWSDFARMVEVIGTCNPQTLHGGSIAQSLW